MHLSILPAKPISGLQAAKWGERQCPFEEKGMYPVPEHKLLFRVSFKTYADPRLYIQVQVLDLHSEFDLRSDKHQSVAPGS